MAKPNRNSKLDLATFLGLLLGLGGILGGQHLEGGHIGQLLQPSAALIVFGGTFGAVLITTPMETLMGAFGRLRTILFSPALPAAQVMEEIIGYATKARKNGLVSLEADAEKASDPFLAKALTLAVDGSDLQEVRKMMELEIAVSEGEAEQEAKVFEAAGGYAPTIGIIGAVMGLIEVMNKINDIKAVGSGIAVAFVATIYGVGSANLLFLPAAGKLKARAHAEVQLKELMLEGVASIVEGLNPKIIRSKLEAFSRGEPEASRPQQRKGSQDVAA